MSSAGAELLGRSSGEVLWRPEWRSSSGEATSCVGEEGRLFRVDGRPHVFLTNGSRLFELSEDVFSAIQTLLDGPDDRPLDSLLEQLGLAAPPYVDDAPLTDPPVRSYSLAVAQACNLGCRYCYASQGHFGAAPSVMSQAVANAAVVDLLSRCPPGSRANLAFLGGEPFVNRPVLVATTEYARAEAATRDVDLRFSVTTNGTLLSPQDCEFLMKHEFSVTVSIDGLPEVHDRLRPHKNGGGSFARLAERVAPLLAADSPSLLAARVTVTPENLRLRATLDFLSGLGFRSVGFSPMLASPTGAGSMNGEALEVMLSEMIDCGHAFEAQTLAGGEYPFANLISALREIHRGTHRPYPCGAGAGYLGVSAKGQLYACHRFVESSEGYLGDLAGGVDQQRRRAWLAAGHVHRQEPCSCCWARYLCGGGCHHEVASAGRPACNYVRGWLEYCLAAYVRMSEARPEFFS